MAIRIGPKGWINNSDVLFGNMLWIVFVLFEEAFFKSVIHSVDGNFAVLVTFHGIEVLFLNKKENQKKAGEKPDNDYF